MKEIILDSYIIRYETRQTSQCSIKISDQLFIEKGDYPAYFIANVPMSFFAYYQADCPIFSENDYTLSDNFKRIIERFPHTNQEQIEFDGTTYHFKHIPIIIHIHTYIQAQLFPDDYKKCYAEIKKMEQIYPLNEKIASESADKRKELFLDGHYGKRTKRSEINGENNGDKQIQKKLTYVNEMYAFSHYSYAAMIEFLPEYQITSYDQFHAAYGHAIYSVTIEKNNQKIPLLWPDYLYHKPENHLEFGILAGNVGTRYNEFNHWSKGDIVTVEIVAEGFEDVVFKSILKKPLKFTPRLSKNDYLIGEAIEVHLSSNIIDELKASIAHFEIVLPDREVVHNEALSYTLVGTRLQIPTEQLENQGRFQLKLYSEQYGQLLFLFTLRKDMKK